MLKYSAAALLLLAPASVAQTSQFSFHGLLSTRGIYVKSQPSWTTGGIGRFDVGAKNPDDHDTVNVDVAQLGFDWTPITWLTVHADGIARREPSGTGGRRAGIVQAYADVGNDTLRLRAGSFWLPTSRENTETMWTSPYTITYSALNSWIAQEVRPVGVDLQFSPGFYVSAGVTAFRGNDTMGTELAARGWTFGNRLSVYNEHLPTPDPTEKAMPIGRDLDGKNGYAERIRIQLPERAILQLTHVDNRAELVPELHGQTPWLTHFNIAGGQIGTTSPTTIAAEWMNGWTELAFPGGTFKMDFDTAYVLVSHKSGADRWTIRAERFFTRDHARSPFAFDTSREHGHAFTVAWFREPSKRLRTGIEYSRANGDRPGAPSMGFDPKSGGSTITAEVRYGF
jgi:hypothetical protein